MIMRDSVNASHIPLPVDVVAGYADGIYVWSSADWARFPDSVHLTIAVHPATSADILDIENSDATPSDAPSWCDRFNRPGRRRPTLYCSRAAWPQVKWAVGARQVDYWIADYTGSPHDLPGAVAVQFHNFGGYDESNIIDPTWVEPVMDYNLVVKSWYLLAFKRNPAQSEIDGWVSRLKSGENGEQVLDEFFSGPEGQAFLHHP